MNPTTFDSNAVEASLDAIASNLEKTATELDRLRQLLLTPSGDLDFDPKDPANKIEIGGLDKFTPRGVEVCYRLFDRGWTRYAVAQAMDISFGAATHRHEAWKKAGGLNRVKQPLN